VTSRWTCPSVCLVTRQHNGEGVMSILASRVPWHSVQTSFCLLLTNILVFQYYWRVVEFLLSVACISRKLLLVLEINPVSFPLLYAYSKKDVMTVRSGKNSWPTLLLKRFIAQRVYTVCKAFPLQAGTGLEDSRRLRFPDFKATTRRW